MGRRSAGSEPPERNLDKPETKMHIDAPQRKAGRLSREDQRRLGDILKRVYDDVIRQGVPDRFKLLLSEIDESSSSEGGERPQSSTHSRSDRPPGRQNDQFGRAEEGEQNGLDSNKGSH
jgi:hypothetical protein